MTSGIESKRRQRNLRIFKGAGAGTFARMTAIATSLMTVPLTLSFLGPERYGMWMTIISFIMLLSFADLGMGSGILSSIASIKIGENSAVARSKISSTYIALSAVALVLVTLFGAIYTIIDWAALFNVTTPLAQAEAAPAVAAVFFCFAIGIPLGIVQRIQSAFQQTHISNIWQCISSLTTLAAVFWATTAKATLPFLVLTVAGVPIVFLALNTFVYFGLQARELRPTIAFFSMRDTREIAGIGGLFLILQILSSATYLSDNIIIAHLIGPIAVAEYSITQKLFSLINIALMVVLAPLWPAYSEAIGLGDAEWVKKTVVRSILTSIAFASIASTALIFVAPTFINWWIGSAVVPSALLLLACGVWKVVEAGGNALSIFLNGANIIRLQVYFSIATAFCAVALKIVLIQHFGVSGAIWATSLSYIVCVVLPVFVMRKKLFNVAAASK
jgi:O-antigen/teichoic acid export membrane protein